MKPFHIAGWSFKGLGPECLQVPGLWSFPWLYVPFSYMYQVDEQSLFLYK